MIKAKKRELLERSAESTAEEIRPKKLKLIIRDRNITTLLEDFEKSSDINATLMVLFDISTFFPLKPKDSEEVFNKFFQVFRAKELDVRLKMISVCRTIVQSGWVISSEMEPSACLVLENVIEEDDDECKAHLLNLLSDFYPCLTCETGFYRRVIQETHKLLFADFWQLRSLALNFLAKLFVKQVNWRKERILLRSPEHVVTRQLSKRSDDDKNDVSLDLENILINFCDDCDERVRVTAVENLIFLHDSNWILTNKFYDSFCNILNDPCETVRLYGLRLIRTMASIYPEIQVPGPNKNVEIRLLDDAFSKLCNAMHDLSVDVRTEAAKLLGTMLNVSEKFLEQTLDKKLMSKLKFLKSTEQKSTSNLLSEWSSGRKFGEDAPVEKIDEDSASLIPSGACGAFVTGLEDEHLAVRNASIDAVCHLSQQSSSFANKAMDFLADMFNDEIEEIRLNAIVSLRKLCQHIILKEDQMEIILNALDDASADSRDALRDLLSSCKLHSVQCLKLTVDALMNNLKRYPQDKLSIWQCMKYLGRNHPVLVQPVVVEYLGYHPFFDTPEPVIDDAYCSHFGFINGGYLMVIKSATFILFQTQQYGVCFARNFGRYRAALYLVEKIDISKLVLVLNAGSGCGPIKSLLLPHTWRHYHYLRNSNDQLVPNLDDDKAGDFSTDNNDNLVRNLLTESEIAFKRAVALKGDARLEFLRLTLNNFERLCEFPEGFNKQKSEFLKLLCGTLLTFDRTVVRSWSTKQIQTKKILKQLLANTYKLQLLWKFDDPQHSLKIVHHLRLRIVGEIFRFDFKWAQLYKSCLDSYTPFCAKPEVVFDLKESITAENFISKIDALCAEIGECESTIYDFSDDVEQTVINVTEPDKNSERVLRFVAGLIASVTFAATLKNFSCSDAENLRIRTTYPDQRIHLQTLRSKDLKEINKNTRRLRTNVFISNGVWSDVSNVELDLIMKIPDADLLPVDETDLQYVSLTSKVPIRVYPKSKC